MTEEDLTARINKLESNLEKKDLEITGYLDKIEQLEETIMKLESFLLEEDSKGSKKKHNKKLESRWDYQLKEKEKQIRELKDNMGFLRKEKIRIQLELEKLVRSGNGTVIRIEEKKEPLETLIKELQDKINKQQRLILKLTKESKKEEIDSLKLRIAKLEKELEIARSSGGCASNSSSIEDLKEYLQEQLKIATHKRKIKSIKKKLAKLEKKSFKERMLLEEFDPNDLKKQIENLRVELNERQIRIVELKNTISIFEEAQINSISAYNDAKSEKSITNLTGELQRKLNKANSQIKLLQNQLIDSHIEKIASELQDGSHDQIITELKKKLKNIELLSEEVPTKNPHVALRWRELKNIIEDLNKQISQQRLEISELRKKIP